MAELKIRAQGDAFYEPITIKNGSEAADMSPFNGWIVNLIAHGEPIKTWSTSNVNDEISVAVNVITVYIDSETTKKCNENDKCFFTVEGIPVDGKTKIQLRTKEFCKIVKGYRRNA